MNNPDSASDALGLVSSSSLILVAILPTPRDLEIARLLGWYRIPFRFAPKVVQVDFLAFYQPASFGKLHANRIETFCEVRGYELARRSEIMREEPNHPRAKEEYYKIQLGPVLHLENPILAGKWKRVTFLYTTGRLFKCAKLIQELVVRNEERQLLWHSLCEKANLADAYYSHREDLQLELDSNVLMMLGDLNQIRDQDLQFRNI